RRGAAAAWDAWSMDGSVDLPALLSMQVFEFAPIPALAAAGEYRGGQVRVSLLAVPRRARLFEAKLTASTADGLAASVPAVLPGQLLRDVRAADLLAVLTVYIWAALSVTAAWWVFARRDG